METKNKSQYYEVIELSAVSIIAVAIISLPMRNLLLSLWLSIIYLVFVFLPFLPLIVQIKTGVVEKFFLTNLAGLSFGIIFVLLDLILKIKLTKVLFCIITFMIFGASFWYSRKLIKTK